MILKNLFKDNLKENYKAMWINGVRYSDPIRQQYADLVNDAIYNAFDNINVIALSKINDLPEVDDYETDNIYKAIANLVKVSTDEYFKNSLDEDLKIKESLDLQTSDLLRKYADKDRKTDKIYKWIGTGTLSLDLNPDDESVSRVSDRLEQDGFELVDRYDGSTDEDSYIVYTKTSGEDKYLAAILFYDGGATLQLEINPEDEDSLEYFNEALNEDKIADKIRANQDTKDMTKRAIKMLKNLGGDYEDLAKEFKDAYGEDPLEE